MTEFEDTGEGPVFDNDDKDDIQLVDEDTVIFSKEERFSHIELTMTAYRKCIEAGCMEMLKGYWESKTDKFGNMLRIYHSDTRLVFIECIKTLKIVMSADLDRECREKVLSVLKAIADYKQQMIIAEEDWYSKQNFQLKSKIVHLKGHLNQDSIFYHNYINYQVEAYRDIFEELELMLKRTNYLKKKMLTN